jgi:cytidylate kinase
VATALAERDRSDTTRADSPLSQAADAVHVETTGLTVEAVVEQVMDVVRRRRNET